MNRKTKIGLSLFGGAALLATASVADIVYENGLEPRRTFIEYSERPTVKNYLEAEKELRDRFVNFHGSIPYHSQQDLSSIETDRIGSELNFLDEGIDKVRVKTKEVIASREHSDLKEYLRLKEEIPTPLGTFGLVGAYILVAAGTILTALGSGRSEKEEREQKVAPVKAR